MPVVRRGRRFAIGKGKATFKSRASAERAMKAVKAKEAAEKKRGS